MGIMLVGSPCWPASGFPSVLADSLGTPFLCVLLETPELGCSLFYAAGNNHRVEIPVQVLQSSRVRAGPDRQSAVRPREVFLSRQWGPCSARGHYTALWYT